MFPGSRIGHALGLTGAPIVNVENASASGSSAFREAYYAVADGRCDIALAVGVGEDSETIEEIYEPYLIQRGFLKRTSAGRVLTRRAYEHFNRKPPAKMAELF